MLGVLTENIKGGDNEKRRAQYEMVMNEIDVNKDGVVDYTEFITAAIDKVSILNKV
jgi:Ca2+-binding EF-hand superfamily protein